MKKTNIGNIEIIIDSQEGDHVLFMDENKAFVKYNIVNETSGNLVDKDNEDIDKDLLSPEKETGCDIVAGYVERDLNQEDIERWSYYDCMRILKPRLELLKNFWKTSKN